MANQVKEQFESNSQLYKNKEYKAEVVANQVKEQFESNSQLLYSWLHRFLVVANQVKEQFESNSQLVKFNKFRVLGCGEPS